MDPLRRYLLFGILFRPSATIAGVRFNVIRRGDRRHYFWVHGDERTAREVLVEHMNSVNGLALLTPSSERNIPILDGKIDPNRMFSRPGAAVNLRSLNPGWTDSKVDRALSLLDNSRDGFLRVLLPEKGRLLVALHNNGPAYSLKDETPISDDTALNDKEHPDEFLLCTMRADFDRLSRSPFNVVLQSKAPKEDDGSLSRLAAARGIRYVNIEAAHGNKTGQKRMLDWLEAELP